MNKEVSTWLGGPESARVNIWITHLTGCWCLSNQNKIYVMCSKFMLYLICCSFCSFCSFSKVLVVLILPLVRRHPHTHACTDTQRPSSHPFQSRNKKVKNTEFIDHLLCIQSHARIFPYMTSLSPLSSLRKTTSLCFTKEGIEAQTG